MARAAAGSSAMVKELSVRACPGIMPDVWARSAAGVGIAVLSLARIAAAAPLPSVDELVRRADSGDWEFTAVTRRLPVAAAVHDAPLEIHDWIEHAYDGGGLRLYVSRSGHRLIAVLADTRAPAFRDAADVAASPRHSVHVVPPYVVVVPRRPVARAVFETVRSGTWDAHELRQRLGPAGYTNHVHGLGFLFLEWVAEGLSFVSDGGSADPFYLWDWTAPLTGEEMAPLPPGTTLAYDSYLDVVDERHRKLAALLVGERRQIELALAAGKPSPDDRFVVAPVNLGGTYNTAETAVMERGKPERRFRAGHFTDGDDYAWLDDQTVLWRVDDSLSVRFSTLDAVTGRREVVITIPHAPIRPAFGVSAPGRFWYVDADGERREVDVKRRAAH